MLLSHILELVVYGHHTFILFISIIHVTLIIRLFGPEDALKAFHQSLKHVAKSGEVWCEGARIYLNPTSRHFNPLNASKCLNFAVFFTPQYGDSFIEALRLAVITSDAFLVFHKIQSPYRLAYLLRSLPSIVFLINLLLLEMM